MSGAKGCLNGFEDGHSKREKAEGISFQPFLSFFRLQIVH